MGNLKYYTEEKIKAQVPDDIVKRAAFRIARAYIKMGLYEEELPDNFAKNVTSDEHFALALKSVEQSTILLQNKEDTLPIKKDPNFKYNVLVVGNASAFPIVSGSGSGIVHEDYIFSPLDAICDEFGVDRINPQELGNKSCNQKTGVCV